MKNLVRNWVWIFVIISLSSAISPRIVVAAENQKATTAAASGASNPFSEIAEEIEKENDSYKNDVIADASDKYIAWYSDYYKRSWEWHLLSTKVIFIVVLSIVFFGLYISWKQFNIDIRHKSDGEKDEAGPNYDISASKDSISIKSKTIGVVILAFSGIFFYLYISIVWPMTSTSERNALPKLASEELESDSTK